MTFLPGNSGLNVALPLTYTNAVFNISTTINAGGRPGSGQLDGMGTMVIDYSTIKLWTAQDTGNNVY